MVINVLCATQIQIPHYVIITIYGKARADCFHRKICLSVPKVVQPD